MLMLLAPAKILKLFFFFSRGKVGENIKTAEPLRNECWHFIPIRNYTLNSSFGELILLFRRSRLGARDELEIDIESCDNDLISLALDAEVHDVVPADGAVVHHDVPGPQRYGVPLLNLEPEAKIYV